MKLYEVVRTNWDFRWDGNRVGFYVTKNGEEVPDTFVAAKNQFDRAGAQDITKKRMIQLRKEEATVDSNERERAYQFDKPLTDIETQWVELDKQLIQSVKDHTPMPDSDLDRYNRFGQIVRRSLLDHSHPAMSHRERIK